MCEKRMAGFYNKWAMMRVSPVSIPYQRGGQGKPDKITVVCSFSSRLAFFLLPRCLY